MSIIKKSKITKSIKIIHIFKNNHKCINEKFEMNLRIGLYYKNCMIVAYKEFKLKNNDLLLVMKTLKLFY